MINAGEAIVLAGFAFWIIGQIWLAMRAFQCSRYWGLAILFIPIAGAAFVIGRWRFARTPFLVNLTGLMMMLIGGMLLSGGRTSSR